MHRRCVIIVSETNSRFRIMISSSQQFRPIACTWLARSRNCNSYARIAFRKIYFYLDRKRVTPTVLSRTRTNHFSRSRSREWIHKTEKIARSRQPRRSRGRRECDFSYASNLFTYINPRQNHIDTFHFSRAHNSILDYQSYRQTFPALKF